MSNLLWRILIHVIDTVTYKFSKYTSIVACSEERNHHTTARTTTPLFTICDRNADGSYIPSANDRVQVEGHFVTDGVCVWL